MQPYEDEVLLNLVRSHVEDGAPLQPVVERMIEMRHHSGDLDQDSFILPESHPRHLDFRFRQKVIENHQEEFTLLGRVAKEVDGMLIQMGRSDLSDWIPF